MSFREKILWATLIPGSALYLWYFGSVGLSLVKGNGDASLSIGGLVNALIVGMIIMIVAVVVMAIANRGSGSMIPDEREHRIESRGISISYHMLCTGIVLTIGAAWMGWSMVIIIHMITFAFILAELTRLIVEIYGLRRGY
jgi:hypothetical protein